MKFKLKLKGKKGKTKPGMWPGTRVPVQSKYEVEKPREKKKYKYIAANAVEQGEYVASPNSSYAITVTGAEAANGDIEIEGFFADGQGVARHYVPEWQPYRKDDALVKHIRTEHTKNAKAWSEWYNGVSKRESKRTAKELKSSKPEAVGNGQKKLRLKIRPKLKLKLKIRRK